jgi:hypothetical protein
VTGDQPENDDDRDRDADKPEQQRAHASSPNCVVELTSVAVGKFPTSRPNRTGHGTNSACFRLYLGSTIQREEVMARKYSKGSSKEVESEMRRYKKGTAKSGKGGKGGKVKSRKQAIAIALSKARKKGKKAPKKR